jgi:hypothetical protein
MSAVELALSAAAAERHEARAKFAALPTAEMDAVVSDTIVDATTPGTDDPRRQ